MRNWFNGEAEIVSKGMNLKECLEELINQYPGLEIRLGSVIVKLNGEIVQPIYYISTGVKEGDEISFWPRMSGG